MLPERLLELPERPATSGDHRRRPVGRGRRLGFPEDGRPRGALRHLLGIPGDWARRRPAPEPMFVLRVARYRMLVAARCFGVINTAPGTPASTPRSVRTCPREGTSGLSPRAERRARHFPGLRTDRADWNSLIRFRGESCRSDQNDLLYSLGKLPRRPRSSSSTLYGRRRSPVPRDGPRGHRAQTRPRHRAVGRSRGSGPRRATAARSRSPVYDQLYDSLFEQAGVQRIETLGSCSGRVKDFLSRLDSSSRDPASSSSPTPEAWIRLLRDLRRLPRSRAPAAPQRAGRASTAPSHLGVPSISNPLT